MITALAIFMLEEEDETENGWMDGGMNMTKKDGIGSSVAGHRTNGRAELDVGMLSECRWKKCKVGVA